MSKKEFNQEEAFKKLFIYVQNLEERVFERFDAQDQKFARIEESLDFLVGEYKKFDDERAAEENAHVRIDDTLDDHDERLIKHDQEILELQTATS